MKQAACSDEFLRSVVGALGRADTPKYHQNLSLLLDQAERLLPTLERHRLGPLWYSAVPWKHLQGRPQTERVQQTLATSLRAAAASAILQEQAALGVSRALRAAGLRHVFFKAVHLRRTIYAPAWLRPADDVDVLVSPSNRVQAREALLAHGFSYSERPPPLTHEESLTWRGAHLDLHWKLFRPGRARFEPADEVLDAAGEIQGLPVPNPEHGLAIVLLATAFGDYVTGRLIRAVDIDRLIRKTCPDWGRLVAFVARLGLKPAAWLTLLWAQHWLSTPVPPEVLASLAPGRLRQSYLRGWLGRDPWRVYRRHPTLARLGFSLALQDGGTDALRATFRRSLAAFIAE